ncbi:MAG: S-layer homology domain-containing protein [Oscillospiraceae bacterium]
MSKKKFLSVLLTLSMVLSLLPAVTITASAISAGITADYAWYTDGPSEEDGFYHIGTAADLAGLANLVNFTDSAASGQSAAVPFSGETVVLDGDIDLSSGVTFTFEADTGLVAVTDGADTFYLGTGVVGNTDGGNTVFDVTASVIGTVYTDDAGNIGDAPFALNPWAPIGGDGAAFSGTFDGGGHTVSGMYINSSPLSYQGLFGYGEDCIIQDVNLDNGFICGADQVGGIAGYLNRGSVSGCTNSCTVTGIGEITPYYSNYYVYVHLGGIVGSVNGSGSVSDCRNTGVISSIPLYTSSVTSMSIYVGGVVGYIKDLSGVVVSDCVNTGKVNTDGTNEITRTIYAAGVLGYITGYDATVSNCENHGTIGGTGSYAAYVGGVLGYLYNSVSLSNCTNTGDVTGSSGIMAYAGGVAGFSNAVSLSGCLNTGNITSTATYGYAGGIAAAAIATSITDANNEGPVSATGTAEAMAMAPPRHGTIGVDNLAGGIAGHFYGGGTASNCRNSGEVNGTIVASNTLGGTSHIGGIIAYNNGNTVINASNTADVTGTGTGTATRSVSIYMGGVTGVNTGTLSNSYNTGNITDTGTNLSEVYLGGVTGQTNKILKNGYNTGSVSGTGTTAYVGGVAGFQVPSVTSELSYCYWLSGAAQTVNGTARTDGFAVGGYYYSSYLAAGTDDYSTNFSNSHITDCYSFDGSGTAWALTGGAYDITPASGSSAISSGENAPLVDALNTWVDTADYDMWSSDRDSSPVNGGYPVLSAVYKPTLSGTPTIAVTNGCGESADRIKIGATLTATANTAPETNLSYQWQISEDGAVWENAAGTGNTAAAYTVDGADAGKYLRVMVTSSDTYGAVCSASSAQVPYTITLTASGSTGTDAVSFSGVSSASTVYKTDSSVTIYYTLADSGTKANTLSFSGGTVTGAATPGTGSATYTVNSADASNGVIAIAAAFAHANYGDITGTPTIAVTNGCGDNSDQINIGAALTATPNTDPGTHLSYQWEVSADGLTNWTNAAGTGNTTAAYEVATGDAAKYLRVKVTSGDALNAVYSASSAQVPYTITLTASGSTETDAVSFSGVSSVSTVYKIDSSVVIYYTLSSSGTGSNTLSFSGGTVTEAAAPGTGSVTYAVDGADASDGVIAIAASFAHTNASHGTTIAAQSPEAPIMVNGRSQDAGTSDTATKGGKTETTVTIDTDKLDAALDSEGDGATVTIPFSNDPDSASGILTGQMVKNMANREAILAIRTDSAAYTLPASEIGIDALAEQFGEAVELRDITVAVTIAAPSDDTAEILENAAEDGGFSIMVPPVAFTVTGTYGGRTVEVNSYNAYVKRTIAIPDGVDPYKITTAVVRDAGGTLRHVPTAITLVDGVYYAVISSLTNSVYTLIYNPVEFADVDGHWAQDAVIDMASRKVITGYEDGTFSPDSGITRAEFAALVVRALGLAEGMGEVSYGDIADTDWCCGYTQTASAYGLVTGYDDGTFRPNDKITREQAMTVIARAMAITKLSAGLSDSGAAALPAGYTDISSVSSYARAGAAACLETGIIFGKGKATLAPKDNITRAESAVILQRLLQKSNLI